MMFCRSVDIFLTYFFSSFCIIAMIGYFSYSVDSSGSLDVSSTVIRSFEYCTRITIYLWLYDSRSTYCFGFLLNFLHWSLASLWLSVVPNTSLKSSNYSLKFRIDDVYDVWLKCPPCPPRPWWLPLPPQPPWSRPQPPLLELDSLMVSKPQMVVASPSLPLLPAAGGSVSIYGVITFPL